MFAKSYRFILPALLAAVLAMPGAKAADDPVKREMRSAWIATVWQLDWPENYVYTTGDASAINSQKTSMTTMLDSLAENNFNAVNFQVRGFCDAMYASSYEPWSKYLTYTRGQDPGYDPLEFVVEECHKRGMECHAWVNPYRYESAVGTWNGTTNCLRTEHPDWLMDVSGASILNPGLPEVTQRIVDVIKEIVQNYDVDGVLFDDYFYLEGTSTSDDSDLYSAYKTAGGSLSQSDWRRENVNGMIDSVYTMIQGIKPWVRFGVSPRGIACTTSAHAAIYDVEVCPSGSDSQYDGIFADPLAWLSRQILDYVSPQIYWKIGYSAGDYSKLVPWWSTVAAKFGRQFFSSQDVTLLTSSSTSAGASTIERAIQGMASTKSSGSGTTFSEFADEVRLNRQYSEDNAPGSVFYSCKYLYKTAPLMAHYLKTTVFNTRALVPAMTFKTGNNPGKVTDLELSGKELSWTGYDNVRYTVYAVPVSVGKDGFDEDAEYLLGASYDASYTIPDEYSDTEAYTYAVAVLDRYGNEYEAAFLNDETTGIGSVENPSDIKIKNRELIIERDNSAQITVKVFTPAGADLGTLYSGTADAGTTTISLGNLAGGFYLIVVDQPEGKRVLKTII